MSPQTIARVFGVLFLITFITAIPAYFFYVPVLDDPRYIVGAGADSRVSFGAFLELLLIIANIGTAVVLYPILRRQNEILALGYVTARIVECVFIAVGILSLLTVVTLRQEAALRARIAARWWRSASRWSRSTIGRASSDPASSSASATG
jgi:hypothetical protein